MHILCIFFKNPENQKSRCQRNPKTKNADEKNDDGDDNDDDTDDDDDDDDDDKKVLYIAICQQRMFV